LTEVSKNEPILQKGLNDVKEFINHENGEIKEKYTYTAMLVALNDQTIQIQRALEEVKDEYDILIQSSLYARQGILQPQVLSPSHLLNILKNSHESFPRDLQVPLTLSDANLYQLFNIIGVEAYMVNTNLVYVVKVPLATHYLYNGYKILPFPVKVQGTTNKFTFIHPEKEYIVIDTTKQFYARLHQEDFISCRQMSNNKLVCKQNFPLQIIHSHSHCGALVLQTIRSVPDSCKQRVLELKETLWAPLRDNSCIFIAPAPEQLTVMCLGQNLMNMEIKESGILTFLADCTGYGNKIMIRAVTSHYVNNSDKTLSQPSRWILLVARHP
jgi:hypothetical protein